ncbi:MAG: hypothetical protein QM594_00475 [Niabella sp.]
MVPIKIGDIVTLRPPFNPEKQYTVVEINGNYATLYIPGQHKDLVIYTGCIRYNP